MNYGGSRDLGAGKPQDRLTRPHTQFPTENVEDLMMVEDVLVDSSYTPIYIGTPRKGFTNLRLLVEKEIEGTGTQQWVRRIWATTTRTGQEAYNISKKYTSEASTAPIFIRNYVSATDTPLTEGTTLKVVTGLTVTSAGSGYSTAPTLAFSGGNGTGAAGKVQIRDGSIVGVLLTNGGSGYTVAPTVTVSHGNGTVTAAIQSQSAYLIKQESKPSEGDLGNLFFDITRVWMELPGPLVSNSRYDERFGAIKIQRKTVLANPSTQVATLTATVKTTFEALDESSVICTQIEETNSDGTGSAGNPAYPIQINDFYDNERGAVDQQVQLVADTTSPGGLTVVGTTVTDIRYEAVTQFHRKKTTETWTVPAPLRTADDYDIQRGAVQTTLQIIAGSSVEATLTASSNVVTETTYRPLNNVLLEKKVQTFAYPGPEIISEPEIDRDGSVFTIKRQLDVASNITEGETIDGGLKIITSEPYSGQNTGPLRYKITKTRALPGAEFTRAEVDGETGAPVSIKMQIIATPSFPIAQTAGTEISYQPISSVHGTKITTSFGGDASSISVVDYPTGSMSAPPLIYGAALNSAVSRDGTPSVNIVWNKRTGKTREVKMTRTKTYGSQTEMQAAQSFITLENPGVIDLIQDFFFIPAIRETGVLTNAVSHAFTTGTENPKWPWINETIAWGDTEPSASGYAGRFVTLSADVEYWKYNLWRMTKIQATTF